MLFFQRGQRISAPAELASVGMAQKLKFGATPALPRLPDAHTRHLSPEETALTHHIPHQTNCMSVGYQRQKDSSCKEP